MTDQFSRANKHLKIIKPKQAWSWSKNAKTQFDLIANIVYLEQLLGATLTQKLVEIHINL